MAKKKICQLVLDFFAPLSSFFLAFRIINFFSFFFFFQDNIDTEEKSDHFRVRERKILTDKRMLQYNERKIHVSMTFFFRVWTVKASESRRVLRVVLKSAMVWAWRLPLPWHAYRSQSASLQFQAQHTVRGGWLMFVKLMLLRFLTYFSYTL